MLLPRDRAFRRICALATCLLSAFGCIQSQAQSLTVITLTQEPIESEGSSCIRLNDSRVICNDLQSAIDWTVEASILFSAEGSNQDNIVEIHLMDGTHTISKQSDLQNASMHLIGLGDGVTVQCDYFAKPRLTESREIHTWYFDRSDSIAFKNVHFKSCGFPFRLDTVRNVDISNCTFRSAVINYHHNPLLNYHQGRVLAHFAKPWIASHYTN